MISFLRIQHAKGSGREYAKILLLHTVFLTLVLVMFTPLAWAQWNNRYKLLDDFGHHTYLEQHELPVLSYGPMDPAPAPDGKTLAFNAQGWIWQLDLNSGEATRLTSGTDLDSRPRWSPDGSRITFVRDTGDNTAVVILDLASGKEEIIDTPAIELDPEFSADGRYLYYTSGKSGSLELVRRYIETGAEETLTDLRQVVRNVRMLPGGNGIVYLHGSGAHRVLRERDFVSGNDRIAHSETLTYHLTADTHPDERLIVYSAPIDNDYHLWTMDLDDPRVKHRLTDGSPFALTPAFSASGDEIFFVKLDENRQFQIMRIPTYGGTPEPLEITKWNYGSPTGTLSLSITNAAGEPITARVSVTSAEGHAVAFSGDATYFDPQTGRHYFYVDGNTDFTLPAGKYTVLAARGPMAPVQKTEVSVRNGQIFKTSLSISEIWDAKAAGYISADHHVHLNGDGHHRAEHEDALRMMAGENLDQLAPMSWNRWERRIDRDVLGKETTLDGRTVQQGQEVRSHFHGHIGLLNVTTPFAPWFFGPYNPTLGDPDLTNGDVFAFAEEHGAFPTYVHPIGTDNDPFTQLENGPIPLELISDGVLEDRMGLELVCAWTSPLGNAEVWYRLLNIGRPVAAMSGTDGWVDFHRTPTMGTGRAYVRTESGNRSASAVIDAAAEGKSFLTTGPALIFRLEDGSRPGDVTTAGRHTWKATLASTTGIQVLEVIVNGEVVQKMEGVDAGETKDFSGEIELPVGGWVAVRAYAAEQSEDSWPSMHARPFAHSSPVWIGEIGSTEAGARRSAAADLIRAIDSAERQARSSYGDVQTPRLQQRFDEARAILRRMTE